MKTPRQNICTCVVIGVAILAASASAGTFELTWFSIDGGGGSSVGGSFALSGTIGQSDAGAPMTGGDFSLTGGYWAGGATSSDFLCNWDFDEDGDVDLSDFSEFSLCFAGANNPPAASCQPEIDADCDGDGDVDLSDFSQFSLCFGGANNPPAASCP